MRGDAGDRRSRSIRTLCVLFFVSGFPALVYQLVWQRALLRIFGVHVESVTVVVTAFMLGLGLGSLAGGWLSRRWRGPLLPLLAAIELATGAFGLASLQVFDGIAALVLGASLPVTAATTLALVAVPTLLMGATLPVLVAHLVRRTASVGGSVGLRRERLKPGGVLLYNTTGSARVQRTGCLAFPHGARFSNELVVSPSPLEVDFGRWRRTLEAYRIDGRPVLDVSDPAQRRVLEGLLSMSAETERLHRGEPRPEAPLEGCPGILARTSGREIVTTTTWGPSGGSCTGWNDGRAAAPPVSFPGAAPGSVPGAGAR